MSETETLLEEAKRLDDAGKHDEADRVFREILEIDPTSIPALLKLGSSHYARGHYDDAIHYLSSYHDLNPTNAFIIHLIGISYVKIGEYEGAEAYFKKIDDLNDDSVIFFAIYGRAHIELQKTKYEEAIFLFQQAFDNISEEWDSKWEGESNYFRFDVPHYMGYCYFKLENWEESEKCFKIAIRDGPMDDLTSHRWLFNMYWDSEQKEKAVGTLLDAMNQYDEDVDIVTILANLYYELKMYERALPLYYKLVGLDPLHNQARLRIEEIENQHLIS